MTPEQALAILEQATGALQLTRADHAKLLEALRVLSKVITETAQKEQ